MASVTFRALAPARIVDCVKRAGLYGIEWGGDAHVPPGDLERAREARVLTKTAGLHIASYGSYYRTGCGEDFDAVVESAKALRAPGIRIWAGDRASADADKAWWHVVVSDTQRIAAKAREAGLELAFEYHPNTLTDSAESVCRLLEAVDDARVRCYWQVDRSIPEANRLADLKRVAPWLSHIHVSHHGETSQVALGHGESAWREYLAYAATLEGDRYALLEFVENGDPDNLMRDARTLIALLDEVQ